jgi:phosphonate transport system substrate-binding protein
LSTLPGTGLLFGQAAGTIGHDFSTWGIAAMPSSLRTLLTLFLLLATLATPRQPAAAGFQVGVVPNVSARIILANYQPFREFLERELKQPVEISTATDFVTFHARTIAGDYDLAITAANLGRLAQVDHGFRVIGIYDPAIPALLVMHKERPVRDVTELKGRLLALANPQSLVALRGIQWLREQGLVAGVDFRTAPARTEDSLAQLLSQEAPLALMSMGEFRAIGNELRGSLQIFREFARVPGFILLAGPRMNAADVEVLRATLLRLMTSDEGRRFGSLAGVQQMRAPLDAELKSLDPFLEETRLQVRVRP